MTLNLLDNVWHGNTGNHDDSVSLTLNSGVLTLVQTVTDADGDSAKASVDLGTGGVFRFEDDGPVQSGNGQGPTVHGAVQEDALTLAGGAPHEGNHEGPGQTTTASDTSGTLNTLVEFGADGPGVFSLSNNVSSLVSQGLSSGGVALSYNVAGNVLTASAGGTVIFTLTVAADGDYSFTLKGPLDHPVKEGLPNGDNELLPVPIDFSGVLVATDGDGDRVPGFTKGSFTIDVQDDIPVAQDDYATVLSGQSQNINMVFVLDFSGSIDNNELNAMLDAVRTAGQALFNTSGGQVKIQIVAFSGDSIAYLPTDNITAFTNLVNSLNPQEPGGVRPFNGDTDFTDAIQETIASYTPISGWNNQVVFISDGNPNEQTGPGGTSLTSPVATSWNNFVDNNSITVTTIGIGNGIIDARLQDIDVDAGPNNTPLRVNNFGDLVDTLLNQVIGGLVQGNVLNGTNTVVGGGDDDAYGADGPGYIQSIKIGATTYSWDGVLDGDQQLTAVTTPAGGKLSFNFSTGAWSYQAPANVNGDLTEDFQYTIIDKDGDPATATLHLYVEDVGAVEGYVDEDELPNGITDGDSVTNSVSGSVAPLIVGPDNSATISLNTNTSGVTPASSGGVALVYTVVGDTLTGTANGATVFTLQVGSNGSYQFNLVKSLDHPLGNGDDNELLTLDFTSILQASGGSGTLAGNFLIHVEDDVPKANDNIGGTVTEDVVASLNGNVLGNDLSGADTPAAFVGWSATGHNNSAAVTALTTYGNFVQNGDGSWTYALDNSRPATQALTSAFNQSYDVWYTMKDADGDEAIAKLTITIQGANDTSSVVTVAAMGPDHLVYEAGLSPNGSNAAANSETATGSFTVAASDGILNVVIGGTTYTFAQMQAFNGSQTINTGEGVLTLLSYSGTATSGTVNYSYTLSATIDNDNKAGATLTEFDDSVTIAVNGVGGTSGSDQLIVRIVDDVPTANDNVGGTVTEDVVASLNGNVLGNDLSGADNPAAFVGWSATGHNNSAAVTALTTYGNFVQNGDGSWTYALDNSRPATQALTSAFNQSYDVWYTMKDADGDEAIAKLTITIQGANDSASVVTVAAMGPDHLVYEAGLSPNGSNAAANSETATGSFTVAASDGILNVVIGGTTYTFAQMQAFNGSQTINTGEGILTLLSYSGTAASGTVNYSYTLSATIDNDNKAGATLTEFDDSVTIAVNGVGGTSGSDQLIVRIVDDVPTANDNVGGTVTEDVVASLNGNVLGNDLSGADNPAAFVGWSATGHNNSAAVTALTTYGNFVQNGDGSWTYALDNSRPATQALTSAFNQSYDVWYTMKDADGDEAIAKLTITIQGADDSQTVTVQAVGGETTTVYETALVDGRNELSDPILNSDGREVVNGTFLVSATDGVASVTILGVTFTAAGVLPQNINTGYGLLDITSFTLSADGKSGTVGYSYTLSDNIINATPATTYFDDIGNLITVTGVSGTTSTASDLAIRIIDDTPEVSISSENGVTISLDESATMSQASTIATLEFVKGDDPDVAGAGAISRSVSAGALVNLTSEVYGADGPNAVNGKVYSLVVNSAASGLTLTDGSAISLIKLSNGVVVGVVVGGAFNGKVAFAIEMNAVTGVATVEQYLSLAHPAAAIQANGYNSYDETVFLAPGSLAVQVALTDGDGDIASSNVVNISNKIGFDDDGPSLIAAETGILMNTSGTTGQFLLDGDGSLANNYGADGGIIMFNSVLNGANSGLTSGGLPITYHLSANGTVLTASTAAGVIFVATLMPMSGTYEIDMQGTVDGGQTTIDFNSGGYNFVGGNGAWAGFNTLANDNSLDILLTPMESGVSSGTVNTNANEGGISAGNSVGVDEAVRVDFVIDLTGSPANGQSYANVSNQNHSFDAHYDVNGASAMFTNVGGSTSVKLLARDDTNSNNVLGDGSIDSLSAVAIRYNNTTLIVSILAGLSQMVNVGGHVFTVTFTDADPGPLTRYSATVAGVVENTQLAAYTADGYNSLEFAHAGGGTFKIGDFGTSVPTPGVPVHFDLPVVLQDGDGDTVNSSLGVNLLPDAPYGLDYSGSLSGINLTLGSSQGHAIGSDYNDTIIGNAVDNIISGGGGNDNLSGLGGKDLLAGGDGNDTLSGGDGDDNLSGGSGTDILDGGIGNDTLIGGLGADTLTGGAGHDTFKWLAGEADGSIDKIADFTLGLSGSNANSDVLDLSQLLVDVPASANNSVLAGTLNSYLTFDTANNTLTIDTNGGTAGGDQLTVLFQNAPSFSSGSNQDIIKQLLDDGNLKVDPHP
ncbi:T1SS-143 repeat domain-containing protein [Aeromonas rivuli]|uniref:T1SS-143 repeat domain-containing protein n=1 Tax=Aeromonas rivuli TaxID=648794 RepID=UPI000693BD63|nr:DUF5801 repeats-in-toxin domain-containing protein [Aeromonas rivuli]